MQSLYASLMEFGASKQGLVAANFILAILLAAWVIRYRRLYFRSRDEQANQRDLIENLSEGIYRSLPNGKQLSANKALVKLNGYDSEAEMLACVGDIGKEWYVEPGRRDEFRAILRRNGFVEDFVSEIYRHKTRERIWITESARLVYDKKTGKPLFYEGSVREITETRKKLQAEQLLQKLSNRVPGGLFQFSRSTDGEFAISYLSDGFRRLTGYQFEEGKLDAFLFPQLVHSEDREAFLHSFRDSGLKMQPWDMEFRIGTTSGEERWLRVNAIPEMDEGSITWHGYLSDVSARKRNEMEIEKLAFYDPLTGLPNRRMFMDRMARSVERCAEHGCYGALLFIDLDNFKTLNDTRGHDIGDEYLAQIAKRLANCVRREDTVARIGGDEFVIILEGAGKDSANASRMAIMTANKVLAAMRDNFEVGRFNHRSSASLGVVVFGEGNARPEEILKHADIAMYQAKAAGRNGMSIYDHTHTSMETPRQAAVRRTA